MLGELVAHFRIVAKLGEGGMGVVYQARDEKLRRAVALKVLPSSFVGDEDRRARFLREARTAAAVTHGNIAAIYEIGEDAGRIFIAMELVEGESLRALLARGALSSPEWLRVALGVARGLAKAHERGIVHRDLKPDNVMVNREGEVKILDFGIARLLEPDDSVAETVSEQDPISRVTREGLVVGTPGYMSPEQAAGKPVDARSDVFSFGVVLYEMATGTRPFRGTTVEVLIATSRDAHAPASSVNPLVSREVEQTIDRCLAKSPEDRPASGHEVLDALSRLQPASGQAIPAPPSDALAATELAPTPLTADPVARSRISAPVTVKRARGAPAWAIALLAAAVAGLGAVAWTRRHATPVAAHAPSQLPASDRRVAFVVTNRGAPEDDWIARALAHMAARRLDERDLRMRAVLDPGAANVIVRLGVRRDGESAVLDATLGDVDAPALTGPLGARGESVVAALDTVLAAVQDRLGSGQPERGPDAVEQRHMASLGAPSFDAYRRYQALMRELFGTVQVDLARLDAMSRELIHLAPGWVRPWVTRLAFVLQPGTPGFDAELATARANVHGDEDTRLLGAAASFGQGQIESMVEVLTADRAAHPDDPDAGYLLNTAFQALRRPQDAIANEQKLLEAFPDLQFGSDLEGSLRASGRDKEAAEVQAAWLQGAPDNEQALTAQASIDVQQGKLDDAVRDAKALVFLFGAQGRLAALADVDTIAGRVHDAASIANRMIAGTGQERADGWLRLARTAILEGRFSDAREALASATNEGRKYAQQGPWPEAITEQASLATVAGPQDDLEKALDDSDSLMRLSHDPLAPAVQLERRLIGRRGACPDLSTLRRRARESPDMDVRMSLRIAGAAGCVPCAEVLRAGLSGTEKDQRLLFYFGVCAETEGSLELARETFDKAEQTITQTNDPVIAPALCHAVLARLHLARVLVRLGQKGQARAAYEDFLAHWGRADRPLPEVDAARKELSALAGEGLDAAPAARVP